jgi:hypothetical protein
MFIDRLKCGLDDDIRMDFKVVDWFQLAKISDWLFGIQ